MHRILSLSARERRIPASSLRRATLSAFFFSGRLRVNQAMPSDSLMSAMISLLSDMFFSYGLTVQKFKVQRQRIQAVTMVTTLAGRPSTTRAGHAKR
jgi:hypothetical protein